MTKDVELSLLNLNPEKEERFFTLQWHLTALCDQHCKHCYMYDSETYLDELKNPLTYEQCKMVMDDFYKTTKEWNIKGRIVFTGGDPLLRKDFFKILRYAKRKGFILGILGNPYHLDLTVANKLRNFGISFYQISIDGLEKTHDKFRRRGSFKESLRALRVLKKIGIKTKVMFTVSKTNKNDLVKVMQLLAKEGVDIFSFSRLTPVGSGAKLKKDLLSPKEYKDLLFKVLEEIIKLKRKGYRTYFKIRENLCFLLAQELGLLPSIPNDNIIYDGCYVGVNSLAILTNGVVYPCRRLPIKIGKVPEQKIKDIFLNSKTLNKLRNVEELKKCSKCDLLQICRGCPAVAYGVHSSFFAPDPQCWKKIL